MYLLLALTLYSLVAVCLFIITRIVYNVFFHPLHNVPEPTLWNVIILPWHLENVRGGLAYTLCRFHDPYGDIVRIAPAELSFAPTSDQLWKTIYAHRPEMPKNLIGTAFPPPPSGVHGIVTADAASHARMRKAILAAFSESALRDQETYRQKYVGKLMRNLHEQLGPVDLVDYFNWTAFDITSDLTFGKSFGGLDNSEYHPWVVKVFETIQALTYAQFALAFNLTGILELVFPGLVKARRDFFEFAYDKIEKRLKYVKAKDRKDFIQFIQGGLNDSVQLGRQELHTTTTSILLAGSETAATHFSGTIFFLLSHLDKYARLRDDIRASFKARADISLLAGSRMIYLSCVMQESARMYPPAPITFPSPALERTWPGTGCRAARWSLLITSRPIAREKFLSTPEIPAGALAA